MGYVNNWIQTQFQNLSTRIEEVFVKKSGDTMTGNLLVKKKKARVMATESDDTESVWMGIGDSGVNHGVYSNRLGKWLVYADNSKIYLNGNADAANKDKNGNDIVNTYYTKSDANNLNVKKKYTIDLSSYANTNFYLVSFNRTKFEIDCEVYSPTFAGTAPYNQNILHFLLTRDGWNDTPKRFIILNHATFSSSEITIASVVSGDHTGNNGIYLRGGLRYTIYSNIPVELHTSQWTSGEDIFPSGTPTCYKTGFTNVSVLIDFTVNYNTGKFSALDSEVRATGFRGPLIGNVTGTAEKATADEAGDSFLGNYVKLAYKATDTNKSIARPDGLYLCFIIFKDKDGNYIRENNALSQAVFTFFSSPEEIDSNGTDPDIINGNGSYNIAFIKKPDGVNVYFGTSGNIVDGKKIFSKIIYVVFSSSNAMYDKYNNGKYDVYLYKLG